MSFRADISNLGLDVVDERAGFGFRFGEVQCRFSGISHTRGYLFREEPFMKEALDSRAMRRESLNRSHPLWHEEF